MLPSSICRIPVTPSIGAISLRVAEIDLRILDDRLIGLHRGLHLGDLRLLGIDKLAGRKAFRLQRHIAIEVGLGVEQLGLVAVAVCDRLVELRLVGARIDFGEHIALVHRLPLPED